MNEAPKCEECNKHMIYIEGPGWECYNRRCPSNREIDQAPAPHPPEEPSARDWERVHDLAVQAAAELMRHSARGLTVMIRDIAAQHLPEARAVAARVGAGLPPAPASLAAPWAEYTKVPVPDLNHVYWLVWAARHMVAVCAGRDADIATVSDQAKLLGVLLAKHFANIPDVVGSKAITPAEPEAGAPGTQEGGRT